MKQKIFILFLFMVLSSITVCAQTDSLLQVIRTLGLPVIRITTTDGENPTSEDIEQVQVHLLVTFQATGLKLKLLNVLYQGHHVVCNTDMVCGTELARLCHVAHTDQQMVQLCREHYTLPFSIQEKEQRAGELKPFNNAYLVELLIKYMTV